MACPTRQQSDEVQSTITSAPEHRQDEPLLRGNETEHGVQRPDELEDMRKQSQWLPKAYSFNSTVVHCFFIVFLVEMSEMLHDPSMIDPYGHVPEVYCKIDSIQQESAILRGWKSFFDTIPVFVVAIPFGGMADRSGRRKVLMTSIIGISGSISWSLFVLTRASSSIIPIRLIWLSSLFLFLGGGMLTANAITMTIASDSCEEKDRSRTFYMIHSAYLITEFVAPFIASRTMDVSLWMPSLLSLLFLALAYIVILVMPESLKPVKTRRVEIASRVVDIRLEEASFGKVYSGTAATLKDCFQIRNMRMVIPIILACTLRPTATKVLLQYASIHYHLKLSETTMLISEIAVVNIVIFMFLAPFMVLYLQTKFHIHPQILDLHVVRLSILLLCVGSLAIGLSPNVETLTLSVAIFAAGFGARISTMSLLTSWIHERARARIYTGITILDNVGYLISSPIMQYALAIALSWPKIYLGLSFFVSAGLFAIASIFSFLIRPKVEAPSQR